MRRVNEVLREVISDAITSDLSDPRLEMTTVTSVETSPDLQHAKVFVTVLGDQDAREDALTGLKRAQTVLQGKIGAEVRMKRTPTLVFEYDESIDTGLRIEELLRAESAAMGERDDADPPADDPDGRP